MILKHKLFITRTSHKIQSRKYINKIKHVVFYLKSLIFIWPKERSLSIETAMQPKQRLFVWRKFCITQERQVLSFLQIRITCTLTNRRLTLLCTCEFSFKTYVTKTCFVWVFERRERYSCFVRTVVWLRGFCKWVVVSGEEATVAGFERSGKGWVGGGDSYT